MALFASALPSKYEDRGLDIASNTSKKLYSSLVGRMASRVRLPRVTLANLRPAPGSQPNQKRVGRGQGSGYGRTAGRGSNGQNSRSGPGPKLSFEGGQTTITKLFPKRGFINRNARVWAPVNLDRIQHWVDQGRLTSSPENPITARDLLLSGCVHSVHDGVKILGSGAEHLKKPLYIVASRASQSAIKAIEEKGGKIVCKFYNELALRDCVKGRTDRISAAPTRREDIQWYTEHKNRGFLSPQTLESLGNLPFVEERWKLLSGQLNAFRRQSFDKQRK